MQFLVHICGYNVETEVTEINFPHTDEDMTHATLHRADTVQRKVNKAQDSVTRIRELVSVGDTALHVAAKTQNHAAAKCLLELGASARARNSLQKTPLHCAVALATDSDDVEGENATFCTFKLLLISGAWVNSVDSEGHSALHVAAEVNATQAMAYLILHTDAHLRAKDVYGKTPLHIAAASGCVGCADILQGGYPETLDDIDDDGNSVLHIAVALKDDAAMIKVLLDFEGVDAELKNKAGKTARDIALELGKTELAEQLLEYVKVENERVSVVQGWTDIGSEYIFPTRVKGWS